MTEALVCRQCYHKNVTSATRCDRCKGDLSRAKRTLILPPEPKPIPAFGGGGWFAGVCLIVGAILAGWVVWTMIRYKDIRELSAVQVTQLYTQATFWMLFVAVVLLAAILYVVSERG